MHAFVNILTAAALLTHALAGCCGHNALGCLQREAVVASAAVPTVSCCGHDHDSPAENHSPTGPCRCVLSCHGSCVTLPPQKTEIDAAPAGAWSTAVVVEQGMPNVLLASVYCWQRGHISDPHQPPLRLHLLHQSLLI